METEKDKENKEKEEAIRKLRVRQLWEASSERNARETGPLNFSKWLEEHHPELLPPGRGDAYERLRAELIHEGEEPVANPAAGPESK
jgi:hypothetical protein